MGAAGLGRRGAKAAEATSRRRSPRAGPRAAVPPTPVPGRAFRPSGWPAAQESRRGLDLLWSHVRAPQGHSPAPRSACSQAQCRGGLFSLLEEERRWPAAGSRNTRPPRGSRAIAYFTWLAEGGPQRRPGPEPWDLGVRPSLEGGLRRSDPMKDLATGRRFWMFRAGPRVSHVSL